MDAASTSDTFRFGSFRLQARGGRLSRLDGHGNWVDFAIGSRALDLLLLLLRHHGEVLSRDEIMDSVWRGVSVEESNLTVQIAALRRVLDQGDSGPSCIQTISGRGYRFVPKVTAEMADDPVVGRTGVAPVAVTDPRRRLSIIVLPFKSAGDDGDLDSLADSITDDLTSDLSCLPGAFVVASASSGEVNYGIQGSVRGTVNLTRVSVQLIDMVTHAHLWAERFDVAGASSADVRDEIIGRLLRSLAMNLVENVDRQIEAVPPEDWTPNDLVMRGSALTSRPASAKHRHDAMRYFERALALDPDFVDAKLGIGRILVSNLLDGWSQSIEQDEARAEQLLLDVLRDNGESAEAHTIMGMLRRMQGRLADSEIELKIAIALTRNNLPASRQLGITLAQLGQPEAAVPLIERSLRLAPHDSGTPVSQFTLGLCRLLSGQVDEAIHALKYARAGNAGLWYTHLILAAALALRGELRDAGDSLRQAIEIRPDLGSQSSLNEMLKQTSPRFRELYRGTVYAGLLRAGFAQAARDFVPLPDE